MKNYITAKHLNLSILMIAIIFGVSGSFYAQSVSDTIYVSETGKTWNDPGLAGQDLSFYHRMKFDIPFLQMIEFKMRREGERRIKTKTTSTNFTPSPRVITLEEMVPDYATEAEK